MSTAHPGGLSINTASTSRISADFQELLRNQFFADKKRTAVMLGGSFLEELSARLPQDTEPEWLELQWRQVASFTQPRRYELDVIRYYEDKILKLQAEVIRYKALAESSRQSQFAEPDEVYLPQLPSKPSPGMAAKLRSMTKPTLRIGLE